MAKTLRINKIAMEKLLKNLSFGSCQAIFTDILGMKCAAAKIVPKLLNFEQKQRRMDIAQEILTTFNDDANWLKTNHEGTAMTLKPKPMQASRSAMTEKSMSSSVKCEGFAHCFLRLKWRGAS